MSMQTLTWYVDAAAVTAVAGNSDAYSLASATQATQKRNGILPQYVDAITGISVWGDFSSEKWYQNQQFWFSSLFSTVCLQKNYTLL